MNPILALLLRAPLHGLGLFVWPLPRSWELALGRALGRAALVLDRKRRRVAEDNIRRCLPQLDLEARRRLLRENYEHYGVLLLELGHLMTPWPGHWRRYAERNSRLEGFELWKKARDKGKGVLFCSAHLANWELMAAAGALAGIPLTITTRRLMPEWLHLWWENARLSAGVRCVYQPRTMPTVMKGLRDGRSMGFVVDQYMVPPMGQKLRFFGVDVDTLAAIAPLARRTGAAIVPVRQVRGADGVVRVVVEPEVPLDGTDDEVNQALASLVERWIRAEPAQWLWVHRRFKNVDWSAADRRTQPA
jgi:KDO2-lipid IV(A) lauroyltransferase